MADYQFPTEIVDLPSKGYFYTETSPLSSGKVELKYMTAKEEDILTSQNLIKDGTISGKIAKTVFENMMEGDKDPKKIVEEKTDYEECLSCQ